MSGDTELRIDFQDVNEKVDLQPLTKMFCQTAEDLALEEAQLAEMVAEKLGFIRKNLRRHWAPEVAVEKAVHGVLELVALRCDFFGETRRSIKGGRAVQIAYCLCVLKQ